MTEAGTRNSFLAGGGELGALTRNFDWSKTVVGPVDGWPQSLRTTVGIILHTGFPMFLWWGEEMIQFYNDAYRPSLGQNGKHPKALGQTAEECWPEIWSIISPLIYQVRSTGKSFLSENQLIPIYRNGTIEDVYWTFSYSAVIGDSGAVDGVLVVCQETTQQVENVKAIQYKQQQILESEQHLNNVLNQVNAGIAQFNSAGDFLDVNDRYCSITGYSKRELLQRRMADIIHADDRVMLRDVVQRSFDSGENLFLEQRYLRKGGASIWVSSGISRVTGLNGEKILTAATIDISDRKEKEKKIEQLLTKEREAARIIAAERQKIVALFMQAPAAIAILTGPEHVFELANPLYMELVGKDRQVIGKTVREALPEISGQGFYEILDTVYHSGKAYFGKEQKATLARTTSVLEDVYINFVYQPFYSDNNSIDAILVHAVDVTDQVIARKKIEESEMRFRNLVEEATIPTGVYTGRDMVIELANDAMLALWGKDKSVIGKSIREALPELDGQPFHDLLDNVYDTGETYWGKEDRADLMVNGELKTGYYNFTYKPLRNATGEVTGVLNMALDITSQVRSRRQVEQSEANLRNTILQAPVAMCLFKGPRHVVEIVNDRMLEIFGKSRTTIMNKPLFDGLTEAKGQGFEELLNNVYRTGKTYTEYARPVTLPRLAGLQTVYVNFVYEAYRESDGNISGIMAVATEVTEQVLARQRIEDLVAERTQELKVANQDLERSNSELSQFAYITSHDLQEPVRKISTFVSMLNRSLGTVDERSAAYLDKINQSARRMLTLIHDVLAFFATVKSASRL